ncbi:MAG: hypothetical protein R3C05_02655 [Pirellulaceae bacterium]
MTTNRCLSLLVDLFNTGIGMLVYRTENVNDDTRHQSNIGWLANIAVAFVFATVVYIASGEDVPMTLTATVLALVVGGCVLREIGVPHFLKMMFVPREVGPAEREGAVNRSAKSFYVADGGFTDYLGVSALLARKCELIVVSDAGANVGDNHLGTLAKMCEKTSAEMGIQFFDLDHESPIDFGRLKFNEQRLVHQPYIFMRIRYKDGNEGLLIYCQMAISDSDPIEIQQIRYRFPTFPDEPTTNQFYTEDQVSAYRLLGYHIANKVCRELERWTIEDAPSVAKKSTVQRSNGEFDRFRHELERSNAFARPRVCNGVPYFDVIQERLLTAYRLACYEEVSYSKDDIYEEAIWPVTKYAFPNFAKHAQAVARDCDAAAFAESWLRIYESSADVRSAYRKAALEDINVMDGEAESFCAALFVAFENETLDDPQNPKETFPRKCKLAAHLAVLATTCQEVHRGRPHAAFQIGGRQKLIQLCVNLAQTIDSSLDANRENPPDQEIRSARQHHCRNF